MKNKSFGRRDFIKSSAAGMIGAGTLGAGSPHSETSPASSEDEIPKIKAWKTLGRTGFKVSDIGCGMARSESIYKASLSAGINLIETSELYGRGGNEKTLGNILKEHNRGDIFLLSKIAKRVNPIDSAEEVEARAHASMERLQTDYLDCYMIHGAESSAEVKNEAFHKAMDKLKAEKKILFRGISCHGHSFYTNPDETFEEVLMAAIEDGRFDVILLPYNVLDREMGGRVLKAARKKNIGTLAMKSNPLLLIEVLQEMKASTEAAGNTFSANFQKYLDKIEQQKGEFDDVLGKYGYSGQEELKDAAVRFILENPDLHSICFYFPNIGDVERYIRLSGTQLKDRNKAMLDDYLQLFGKYHCRIGCNQCESACPHKLPVGTIMRYSYYFNKKKMEKDAMQQYHELSIKDPEACKNCPGYCQDACPHGVYTQGLMAMAHHQLGFDHHRLV